MKLSRHAYWNPFIETLVENLFRQMESEGERTLRTAGATDKVSFARSVVARFIGQGYETNLPLPDGSFSDLDPADLRFQFDQAYERLYGRTYPEIPVEIVNFRVRASLPVQALELPRLKENQGSLDQAIKGERLAYSDKKHDFIPFKVYDRYKLFPDATFPGPAIVEERESTVVVGEDATVRIDGRWVLTGRKDSLWGLLPPPGVSDADIAAASRFGRALADALPRLKGARGPLLAGLGAVKVNPGYVAGEKIAHRSFQIWGRLLRALGRPGTPLRRAVLGVYILFLVAMILTVLQVSMLVRALLRPLLRKKLDAEVARLEAPSGSSTERLSQYA